MKPEVLKRLTWLVLSLLPFFVVIAFLLAPYFDYFMSYKASKNDIAHQQKPDFINTHFYYWVRLLNFWSHKLGITYQELNVYAFLIIHPLLTMGLFLYCLHLLRKTDRLKKRMR